MSESPKGRSRGTRASSTGPLLASERVGELAGIYLEDHAGAPLHDAGWVQDEARFADARRQLAEYFAGTRTAFDLSLSPEGTRFQQRVWAALMDIPFAETLSYAELARRVGVPRGARAVGGANARNPLSIVVPCHRVIGSDGSLAGYAGGEEKKRWLPPARAPRRGLYPRRVNTRLVSPGSSS